MRDNTDLDLELLQFPSGYIPTAQVHIMFKEPTCTVPQWLLNIHPMLTPEKMQHKRNDPLFLYEGVKLCTNCYKYVKTMIEHVNLQKDSVVMMIRPKLSGGKAHSDGARLGSHGLSAGDRTYIKKESLAKVSKPPISVRKGMNTNKNQSFRDS